MSVSEPVIYGFIKNQQIQMLLEDLKSHNGPKAFRAFVRGQSGTGKSTLIQNVLMWNGYSVYQIDLSTFQGASSTINPNRQLKDVVSSFMKNNTVDSYFSNKHKVLIFDDIDSIHSSDISFYSTCNAAFGDTSKNVSIIVTYKTSNEKHLSDMRKSHTLAKTYSLTHPTIRELTDIVSGLCIDRGIDRCSCKCSSCVSHYDHGKCDCDAYSKDKSDLELIKEFITRQKKQIGRILLNLHDVFRAPPFPQIDENQLDPFVDIYTTEIASMICSNPENLTLAQLSNVYNYDTNMVSYAIHENYPVYAMKERCGNNAKDQLMLMIGMSSLYSTADILDSYNNRNMVWGGLTASCAAFYKIGQVKVALTSFSKKSSLYDPYRFTTLLTKGAKLHNTFKKICGFQMLNDLPLMNVPVFETFASQLIHAIAKKNLSMEECYQMIDKSGSDLLKKMFDDFVALKPYEKKCKKILTIIDKKASAYDSQ